MIPFSEPKGTVPMNICFQTFAAALVAMANAVALAQGAGGDAEPDTYTKLKAVQIYMQDGSSVMMARACTETIPEFMSEFLPKFTDWRAANAKQIALGSALSAQFKGPKGEPMDPAALGQAAAQQVRALAPDERGRECNGLLRDLSAAAQTN
jgi:hypothetical protein